jgi:imidazolonepropionase-like amidohydrolase
MRYSLASENWGRILISSQVLKAATVWAAETLNINSSVGTLSPGKLADLLIYPPETNLLNGPISGTRDLEFVMRGGRVWNASTMEQVWPKFQKAPAMPPLNAE